MNGRRVKDIVAELASLAAGAHGVAFARLIGFRHELTALIKSELYGGGDKEEGRAALIARQSLDEFVFHCKQSQLAQGHVAELDSLKMAIILETLLEQTALLEQIRDAGYGSRNGIKMGMLKLMDDPDRFDRFNDADKAAIGKIAHGLSFFVTIRFNRMLKDIARRSIPFMNSIEF